MLSLIIKNKYNIITFCICVLGIIGISLFISITDISNSLNNLLYLFIFFISYEYTKKNIKKFTLKNLAISLFSSIALSSILICGTQLDKFSTIIWSLKTLLAIFFLAIFLVTPINSIYLYCKNKIITPSENDCFVSKHRKKISFSIILFFWFLVYLALFPGIYGYDSGFQYLEFADINTPITSHFSIAYSFIFYVFISLGKNIFNSYVIGFGIYSLLQMTFLVYVASRVCVYVYSKTYNLKLFFCAILFFAIIPLFPVMAISSSQDQIFSGLFVLIILNTLELLDDRKLFFSSPKKILTYILLIFLLFIFRNNGLYLFIFVIPFLLIINKKNLFKALLIVMAPIIIFKLYNTAVFNILNVVKGDSIQEMISVPAQQIARAYLYNHDSLSEKDKEDILELISDSDLNNYYYRQSISDPIKGAINTDLLKSNPYKYINLYLRLFLKSPKEFLEAFLLNSLGFWYPNKDYYDSRMYHPYIEYSMLDAKKWNPNYIEIERHSMFPIYERILNQLINHNYLTKLPILGLFSTLGTYFILFVFTLFSTLYNKKFKYLLPLSYLLGLYVTLFLSPVALFRYGFSTLLVSPLYVIILFNTDCKKN